ncbi:PKD domain-containing protein [candidate division GN15 bacterium]|nr:PKD domain-containing protein [candidate division GN15 bacterium]
MKKLQLLLLFLTSLALLACRPACYPESSITYAPELEIGVVRGGCVELRLSTFDLDDIVRFCDPKQGLYLLAERDGGIVYLCAQEDAPIYVDEPISVIQSREVLTFSQVVVAPFLVTVGDPGTFSVTAIPDPSAVIDAGGSVGLGVQIAGGSPPYTFDWSPGESLDDSTSQSPTATPDTTTVYTVVATDNDGDTASSSTTIFVNTGVTITADSDTIPPGGSAQLTATPTGGVPPYTFSWVDDGTISDTSIANPTVSPFVNTTYEVEVTDSQGNTGNGTIRIIVRLQATAMAMPDTIAFGGSSQLDVFAQGGALPRSFVWVPSNTLNDNRIQNPIASPGGTTDYAVIVTDAEGAEATDTVTVLVEVNPDTLAACFEVEPNPASNVIQTNFDATCSVGPIVEYRWWFDFQGEQFPPDVVSSQPTTTWFYELTGEYLVVLQVIDADSNTAVASQTLEVQ